MKKTKNNRFLKKSFSFLRSPKRKQALGSKWGQESNKANVAFSFERYNT